MIVSLSVFFFCLVFTPTCQSDSGLTCSVNKNEVDPALSEMRYDIGHGPKTTMVYVEPDVTTFYRNEPAPASTRVTPLFNGFQAKFINLSPKSVSLYWEDRHGGVRMLMANHKPFTSSGTATFPGHRFLFTEPLRKEKVLKLMVVGEYPENLYIYDPLTVEGDLEATLNNLNALTTAERSRYQKWRDTVVFNEFYLNATGRSYLANYLRVPPIHHMWRGDYFGQEHWTTTKETQFVKMPPSEKLQEIKNNGKSRILEDDEPRILEEYRDPWTKIMNMTLKCLSVVPRAFEIPNFLSQVEVDHILNVANAVSLKRSVTGDGEDSNEDEQLNTRTSFNSWLPREKSPIIDAIYRRAADLQLVDEALMRYRDADERPDIPSQKSVSEHMQLVHYEKGQEYTAHHDFGFPHIDDAIQGERFSTLLLYLNDEMKGGETSFPRYVNTETFHKLAIKPEVGKAVLFYSQLPDGNMDDFSHHAAEPVISGEKWLMNLWLWDPVFEN